MKSFEYKFGSFAIVFTLAFGMFATAQAESVSITNYINTYSNSGGVVKNGADGQAGAAGRDGEAGQPGKDGETIIQGNGKATVHVKTTVNGETKTEIFKSQSASGTTSVVSTSSTELTVEEKSSIIKLLQQIRLILLSYVPNFN